MKRSILRTIFVSTITLAIFYVIFRKIDFFAVINVLSRANPIWLALVIFLSFFGIAIIAKRWQILLKMMEYNFQYKECFNLVMGALPLTSITPSKSGDLIKAYYLKGKVPASRTIGAVIAERTFDVLSLVLISLVGAIFCKKYEIIGIMIFIIICIIVTLFIVHKSFNLPIRESWNEKLKNLAYSMKRLTNNKRVFVVIVVYSLFPWLLAIIQTIAFFYALKIDIPLSFTMANIPIAIFIGLIPVTLGGMGTRDAAIIFLFSEYATPSELLGVGILFSIFKYWLMSLIGIPFMRKMMR